MDRRPRPSAATTPSPRRSPTAGSGYPREYAQAFARLEREYVRPPSHETHSVTTRLIAPTIMACGTDEQRGRVRADGSSPPASCAASCSPSPAPAPTSPTSSCRAVRDGDEWVINGQKVWSSGALFSEWGELIARSDPDVPKHKGMTAFIVPMDLPGIEVRPIKQMSGGSSFNEVFFTDVRVPDSMRLGDEGDGWRVALTTLGFERDHSDGSGSGRVGGGWQHVLATARAMGVTADPVTAPAAGPRPTPTSASSPSSTGGPPSWPARARRGRRARWASCCGRTG